MNFGSSRMHCRVPHSSAEYPSAKLYLPVVVLLPWLTRDACDWGRTRKCCACPPCTGSSFTSNPLSPFSPLQPVPTKTIWLPYIRHRESEHYTNRIVTVCTVIIWYYCTSFAVAIRHFIHTTLAHTVFALESWNE